MKQILKIAKNHGIKILYGLGVYSWGFDEIIKANPSVQGTNQKVRGELPLGEIHLTCLFGTKPGPAVYLSDMKVPKEHEWYLTKTMTPAARTAYGKKLIALLNDLKRLEPDIGNRGRLQRIKTCLNNVLADLGQP